MLNIAVFVSGRGSNFRTVFENVPKEKINFSAVVSDRIDALAVKFAEENNIPVYLVSNTAKKGFVNYEFLIELFNKKNVNLVLLAGFLKKIPDFFIDAFENKIINIHPALLPKFGGKGMYGLNVHKAVLESSEKFSGATVHFVDKIYDHGKIIAQRSVDIGGAKSAEEIAGKVLKIEHELLPFVVEKFADNKIVCENNGVVILD